MRQMSNSLRSNKISFTACDFFVLNNRLLTSVRMKNVKIKTIKIDSNITMLFDFVSDRKRNSDLSYYCLELQQR